MPSIPNAGTDIGAAQAPPPSMINLDHVAHFVPDVDAASEDLEALGFTLTPFSPQSHRLDPSGPLVAAGTGNRCVMFERGYLEFLTPIADTPLAQQLRDAIARYVGVHLIAFGTSAPDADYARLSKHGFDPLTPVKLQRPISIESGEDTARFTVVRVPPGTMPEGRIQFCQHHTPDLVWQRRWYSHANGVTALAGAIVCVEDPAEAASRFRLYTGMPAQQLHGAWHLATARGTIDFVDRETLEARLNIVAPPATPWIAGYVLACRDVETIRRFARAANIDMADVAGPRVLLRLSPALGGIALIEQEHAEPLRWDA